MTKVVSFINLKGGVGKTALAVNFAAFCGQSGKSVLLIDLDPQTNATFSSLGIQRWNDEALVNGTVADLLGVRKHSNAEDITKTPDEIIVKEVFDGVDLIPSHIDLFTIDLDLGGQSFRETKLKKALKDVKGNYEIIICDCPPNLTLPTQNALAFSTHFVIPVTLDFLSSIGIGLLLNRVKEFSQDLDHDLKHAGIVISRVGRQALHRQQTHETLKEKFGALILDDTIAERAAVSSSAQKNESIFSSNNADAIREFEVVCEELLKRVESE